MTKSNDLPEGNHPNLTPYKGRAVVGATVKIRNTGDGLSSAMAVEPVELEVGTRVHVVLECVVEKHLHEPEEKNVYDRLILVNDLKAGRATIVDGSIVRDHLDEQQRKIEEADGVLHLPGTGDDGGEFDLPEHDAANEWDDEPADGPVAEATGEEA